MSRVTASLWVLCIAASVTACAGSRQNTPVNAGSGEDSPSYAKLDGRATNDGALPRYLTLEVRAEGLWLDGERVSSAELEQRLGDASADPALRGVALIFYAQEPPASTLLARVARAGFSHVVISGLSQESFAEGVAAQSKAPSYAAASAPQAPAASAPEPNPGPEVVAEVVSEEPEQSPSNSDVIVKHYGLHIGGGPNTDEVRQQYLEPIGSRFEDLRQCHLLAKQRKLQASFGVDLLIAEKGGRAKIKDYRTQLDGKDFQLCVLGVLGDIVFPAPGKATVVSYSVLFKPGTP